MTCSGPLVTSFQPIQVLANNMASLACVGSSVRPPSHPRIDATILLPTNSFILLAPVAISSAKCLRSVSKPIGAPVSGYLISRQISASGTPPLLDASTQPLLLRSWVKCATLHGVSFRLELCPAAPGSVRDFWK